MQKLLFIFIILSLASCNAAKKETDQESESRVEIISSSLRPFNNGKNSVASVDLILTASKTITTRCFANILIDNFKLSDSLDLAIASGDTIAAQIVFPQVWEAIDSSTTFTSKLKIIEE